MTWKYGKQWVHSITYDEGCELLPKHALPIHRKYGILSVFIVGDTTLATFPGSVTPRFATQTALANAALTQLITQANWARMDAGR